LEIKIWVSFMTILLLDQKHCNWSMGLE
jgi:hypothetical protein